MDPWKHQHDREEQARREVGATELGPRVARGLAFAFLAVLVSAGVIQFGATAARTPAGGTGNVVAASPCNTLAALAGFVATFREVDAGPIGRLVAANRTVERQLTACEEHLEDESVVGRAIRPPIQRLLTNVLGAGKQQAYVGRGGWLFYRPDVDHVTGPGFLDTAQLSRRRLGGDAWTAPPEPDPRPVLIDLHEQLAARGITLIVVPTPVKPSLHPERLSPGATRATTAVLNASHALFLQDLAQAGVDVFDPAPLLWQSRQDDDVGRDQYLATDTHWRPDTMARVAVALGRFIEERADLPPVEPAGYRLEPLSVQGTGDVIAMLDIPEDHEAHPPETVTIQRVITSSGDPWRAEASADVLLLGDSFSNIYSLETMGWGSGAGLAERLAFELQRPVDRIARNDNGAYAPRQALASELGRGRDRLASTRVVIYQFAARELSFGDWRPIELPAASTPSPGRFLTVPAGEARLVVGTILSASVVPRPGTVPYRDHIRSLHITAIEPADDGAPFPTMEAVVYVWSMRENEWTDAASYRPGDRVTLRIRGWDDVADDYGGVNRSELEDERLLLVEPVWGEADAPAPR